MTFYTGGEMVFLNESLQKHACLCCILRAPYYIDKLVIPSCHERDGADDIEVFRPQFFINIFSVLFFY